MTNRSFKNKIMPRTKEQFEELRQEKINMIKQVTLELFASEGYIQTSISKIAKKANISKGLLYNYFESKEELLKSIVSEGVQDVFDSFDKDGDGHLSTEEFEYFVRQSFKNTMERKEFYKLLYTIMLQPNVHDIIANVQNDISVRVLTVANEYFQTRFDDPQTEFLLFSSMMKGLNMQYVFTEGYISDEMMEKSINRILDYYRK